MKDKIEQLLDLLRNAANNEQAKAVLSLFMTFDELNEMKGRVRIIGALAAGALSQRAMSSELKVSIAKITRGSNALKHCDESLLNYIKTHLKAGGV